MEAKQGTHKKSLVLKAAHASPCTLLCERCLSGTKARRGHPGSPSSRTTLCPGSVSGLGFRRWDSISLLPRVFGRALAREKRRWGALASGRGVFGMGSSIYGIGRSGTSPQEPSPIASGRPRLVFNFTHRLYSFSYFFDGGVIVLSVWVGLVSMRDPVQGFLRLFCCNWILLWITWLKGISFILGEGDGHRHKRKNIIWNLIFLFR